MHQNRWPPPQTPLGGAYIYHWWNPWHITQNHCTRCFHLCPKCTKIVGGWGSAPDSAGGTYMPLMKSMTHYSESLHQMLPFMSKMHQNRWRLGLRPRPRWGAYSAAPGPLPVKGWDGDLVTTLVGVDFDMCPLACDRCPLAVLGWLRTWSAGCCQDMSKIWF